MLFTITMVGGLTMLAGPAAATGPNFVITPLNASAYQSTLMCIDISRCNTSLIFHTTNDTTVDETRTFTIHVSNPSVPADVSAVGTVTIFPHAQIPADCLLSPVSNRTLALTCSNRPVTQQWKFTMQCPVRFIAVPGIGNVVTGNGTSSATCTEFEPDAFRGDTGNFVVTG